MALSVHAGWDFSEIGTFTLVVTDPGGTDTITANSSGISATGYSSTTTTYANVDFSVGVSGYTDFADALELALNGSTVLTGNWSSSGGQITHSKTTGLYTLVRSGSGAWSIDAGTNALARNILGIATSGAISATLNGGNREIVGTREAYYSKIGAIGARSGDTGIFEPDDVAEDAEDDSGASFGISITTAPKYREWLLQFETEAATFKHKAAAGVPWTWEHFFEHCRVDNPFALSDDGQDLACYLRADGAAFRPQIAEADWHAYWHIPFRARVKHQTTSGGYPAGGA